MSGLDGASATSRSADLEQFALRGQRAGVPGLRFFDLGGRLHAQQHGADVDAGDAVDHRVVGLEDHREAAAGEAVDQPHLPERLAAVEALAEDAGDQALELLVVAGRGQRGVAHVVVEVEVGVVGPERAAGLEARPDEALAVARHEVQARLDVRLEEAELGRRALEDHHAADVHVRAGALLDEERSVGCAQAGKVLVGHLVLGVFRRWADVRSKCGPSVEQSRTRL